MKKIRSIAIHLPQFHPIPENDVWWGKGFTEWRNVVQAKPRFMGHYQPHIPADLGFYDLRLPEVRQQQAELAKAYGIYGFCYYHYWFNGRQVLERPLKEILESGKPDFPFMLCWANENWTKIWDGTENNVLLEQKYSDEDHYAHAEFLIPFFKDPRYIKVENKPVFVVYKDALIPNLKRMTEIFREVAARHGLELYLCRFEREIGTLPNQAAALGFDAGIEFQPNSKNFHLFKKKIAYRFNPIKICKSMLFMISTRLNNGLLASLIAWFASKGWLDNHINYAAYVDFDLSNPIKHDVFPGVSPSWDNSSRLQFTRATIIKGSTPKLFKKWVESKIKIFNPPSPDENFLFINAWNEWAEGNHLEPCLKYGHGYLEALKQGLKEADALELNEQQ